MTGSKYSENIFKASVNIAEGIIKSGGEISRAEDTVTRINAATGQSCRVFALPSLIIAQCNGNTQIRRIYKSDINLCELIRLNSISRRLCGNYSRQWKKSDGEYSSAVEAASVFAATGAFAVFFGGNLTDAVFAGIIGIIISPPGKRTSLPVFISNLADSFTAGVLSFLPQLFGFKTHQDKIIIGTIMVLVPGLTVVNAIRDMMSSDMFAGLTELATAIISALAIAFGAAGAAALFSLL